jgi:hypothetical protein
MAKRRGRPSKKKESFGEFKSRNVKSYSGPAGMTATELAKSRERFRPKQKADDKGNIKLERDQRSDKVKQDELDQAKETKADLRLAELGKLDSQKSKFKFTDALGSGPLMGTLSGFSLLFGDDVVGQNQLEKIYEAQQAGIPISKVIGEMSNKQFNTLLNTANKLNDPSAQAFLANTLKIDGEPVANIGDLLTTVQGGIPTAADPLAIDVLNKRANNPDLTIGQQLKGIFGGLPEDYTSQVDAKKALGPRLDKIIQSQNPELYYGDTDEGGYGFRATDPFEVERLSKMKLGAEGNSKGLDRAIMDAQNQMRARRGNNNQGDPDPISGQQPSDPSDPTDPTDPTTPADPGNQFVSTPGAFYTFFDPVLGRYRTGTYDEYLQYVTAKDGGIIQLQEGGDPMEEAQADNVRDRAAGLRELVADIKEFSNVKPETEGQMEVKKTTDKMLRDELMKPVPLGSGIMMAENDQPAESLYREDLGPFKKFGDSALSLFMEPLRKSNIATGSPNDYIDEAINTLIAQERLRPGTSYDQLTDQGKELVFKMAESIAIAERTKPDGRLQMNEIQVDPINMFEDPQGRGNFYLEKPVYKMIEGMPEDLQQMKPFMQGPTQDYTDRPLTGINTPDIRMLEAANGGIIGLKDGGMDDMMAADSLMFKDPSDEGEWEYNV